MRARELELPAGAGADWAVPRGLIGIGASAGERGARLLHRFATVEDGALAWTRHSDGSYRLGRIAGAVRRVESPAGIVHVRPAQWLPEAVGEREAPPRVAYAFARGGRNFQRIRDAEVEEVSERLWHQRGPVDPSGSRP